MYKIETISSYFIDLSNQREIDEEWTTEWISPLKLQKILYFAQAVFLSIKSSPLFEDEILAWKYWPVIESIYRTFKSNWSTPLKKEDILNEEFKSIIEEDKKLLDEIYKEFWKYSAWELVDITHNHKPWKESFEDWKNNIISKDNIKEYYKNLFSVEE